MIKSFIPALKSQVWFFFLSFSHSGAKRNFEEYRHGNSRVHSLPKVKVSWRHPEYYYRRLPAVLWAGCGFIKLTNVDQRRARRLFIMFLLYVMQESFWTIKKHHFFQLNVSTENKSESFKVLISSVLIKPSKRFAPDLRLKKVHVLFFHAPVHAWFGGRHSFLCSLKPSADQIFPFHPSH